LSVRAVPRAEGQALIDLARAAMVVRSRDLDVFAWGDPADVRMVDWDGGLSFACIGAIPERRLLQESVYGLLTLQNGVPVGYVLFSALCGSSEVAYNVFETWRGGEGAFVYGRVLATARHLFGSDSFTIYPYQLGDDNDEALQSGAWWFYQKLGFRPKDRGVLALMRRELAAMRRRPRHRSSIATLRRLARENVYYHLGRPRDDVIGLLDLAEVGLAVTDLLARRFGPVRSAASRACLREARAALGLGGRGGSATLRGWTPGERQALQRWAPLVLLLRAGRWRAADRRALVAVIRAKGGARESDFVALFDRHRRLRAATRIHAALSANARLSVAWLSGRSRMLVVNSRPWLRARRRADAAQPLHVDRHAVGHGAGRRGSPAGIGRLPLAESRRLAGPNHGSRTRGCRRRSAGHAAPVP
jgi:hypothetical protein